ncbi:MAG: hypothetical protein AAB610_02895 [Patescibacteria group bacterium]
MIHLAYRAPRYSTIIGKIFEKIAFSKFGLPKGFPTFWRNGNHLAWRKPTRAPHSISCHLIEAFKRKEGKIKFYDLYENTVCNLKSGDIFIGVPIQVFEEKAWGDSAIHRVTARTLEAYANRDDIKKVVIMPYTHDPRYNIATTELIKRYGKNLIIVSGEIWKRTWDLSPLKEYVKDLLQVEMAVDSADYPVVKKSFNAPGKRKYLYVGHTGHYKNIAQMEALAEALPDFQGGHIGLGTIKGWKKISDFADLTPEFMSKIAEEYDIFMNTSSADASVTTVLEQMCFGFAVACTPESGYAYDSIAALSINDTQKNVELLTSLQNEDEQSLLAKSRKNREYAIRFHNWDIFTEKIYDYLMKK